MNCPGGVHKFGRQTVDRGALAGLVIERCEICNEARVVKADAGGSGGQRRNRVRPTQAGTCLETPPAAGAVILTFLPPAAVLSMNERLGWHAKAPTVRAWRAAARNAAWETADGPVGRGYRPPSTVAITLPFATNRRRDPANYYATVKPIVDGLVDAQFWPDDTPDWVSTVEPRLIVGAQYVTVEVTPR